MPTPSDWDPLAAGAGAFVVGTNARLALSGMRAVAGVDACRGGWVAIVLEDGQFADSLLATTFA